MCKNLIFFPFGKKNKFLHINFTATTHPHRLSSKKVDKESSEEVVAAKKSKSKKKSDSEDKEKKKKKEKKSKNEVELITVERRKKLTRVNSSGLPKVPRASISRRSHHDLYLLLGSLPNIPRSRHGSLKTSEDEDPVLLSKSSEIERSTVKVPKDEQEVNESAGLLFTSQHSKKEPHKFAKTSLAKDLFCEYCRGFIFGNSYICEGKSLK